MLIKHEAFQAIYSDTAAKSRILSDLDTSFPLFSIPKLLTVTLQHEFETLFRCTRFRKLLPQESATLRIGECFES